MRTRFVVYVLCLVAFVGCASTSQYAGQECESVTDFDQCVQCFAANNWIGSPAHRRNPQGIEFLIDSAQYLTKGVMEKRYTKDRARALFSSFMRKVGTGHAVESSELAEAGIPLTHPYFVMASTGLGGGGGASDAPCVSGTCGPVQVKGYVRKDGTYVRPHTRSAPGGGGRRR